MMTDNVRKSDDIDFETYIQKVTVDMEVDKNSSKVGKLVEAGVCGHVEACPSQMNTNNHKEATRVASNLSSGSCDDRGGSTPSPISPGSKKLSLTSTLSTGSGVSDAPYITMMSGYSRNRKVSEGLPPFLSMLSQNDAETEAAGNMFEVIEEESWRGENKLYGPHGPPGTRKNGQKKITRERKEIFPGYERIVQTRQNMTGEEAWKQIDDDNNDGNDTSDDDIETRIKADKKFQVRRRKSFNPNSLIISSDSSPGHTSQSQHGSGSDLRSQFSRQGLRATVCNAELKSRNRARASGESPSYLNSSTKLDRTNSVRKPLQKLGDGFLKTLRNLKKK